MYLFVFSARADKCGYTSAKKFFKFPDGNVLICLSIVFDIDSKTNEKRCLNVLFNDLETHKLCHIAESIVHIR